jgi:predicted metal-dependent hydrolase
MNYLKGYPAELIRQVEQLHAEGKLTALMQKRYPDGHQLKSDKELYNYTNELKQRFLKNAQPLSKVVYDSKISMKNQALGLHTFAVRMQGKRLKSKNEIRISSAFKHMPEPFLRLVVVHELAHLKEKEHNKAFYKLCQHMEPNYHQLEFDMRICLSINLTIN